MTLALYRKYRPQTFGEVVGQNHIKITLQSELESGDIAHAYLFSGPRGLGKTTTARLLAKSLNCQNRPKGQSEPCNQCDSCSDFNNNKSSVDVVEIDAASHTGVDNVRENIIQSSRFAPTFRSHKVFIIDEVHMLSISAFNALLKTLEEPPAKTLFILATTEVHKVPQTIISRCQHFEFRKVSLNEIIERLAYIAQQEGKKISQKILGNIASYAEGSLRDAESLLGQILSLDKENITDEQAELVLLRPRHDSALELINLTYRQDASSAIVLINELLDDGVQMAQFATEIIETLRVLILHNVGIETQNIITFSSEHEKLMKILAKNCSMDFLVFSLEVFIAKKQDLRVTEVQQLPLELAVLEIIQKFNNQAGLDSDNGDTQPPSKLMDSDINQSIVDPWSEKQAVQKTPVKKPKPEAKIEGQKEITVKKNQSISIQKIQDKWPEVLTLLEKRHHPLAVTLKTSNPISIDENNILQLNCHHRFHQQRINDHKNRIIIEKILQDIFLIEIGIRTELQPDSNKENVLVVERQDESIEKQDNKNFENILEAFDGEMI